MRSRTQGVSPGLVVAVLAIIVLVTLVWLVFIAPATSS